MYVYVYLRSELFLLSGIGLYLVAREKKSAKENEFKCQNVWLRGELITKVGGCTPNANQLTVNK